MGKCILYISILFFITGCVQTQGLNTARVNVDQYNKNQLERLEASGLMDDAEQTNGQTAKEPAAGKTATASPFTAPLSRPKDRVTKKPFGIEIDPKTSPVQPERFAGYHTGTDFEVLPGEETTDVPVFAVCQGPLLQKMSVSGYGGVAVQSCSLDGAPVTIVYGHLRLSSIKSEVGEDLKPGLQFAVLGAGNSAETDNERKHLHLGIRRGADINLLGYVQKESEIKDWVDIMEHLK